MKIRDLSVKNCLSFCDKGLNKDNSIQLSDFNLFIGSNNAGKSNVLRLLELIRLVLRCVSERGNDTLKDLPIGEYLGDEPRDWLFAQGPNEKIDFGFSLELESVDQATLQIRPNEDRRTGNPVFIMLDLKTAWPKVVRVGGFIDYSSGNAYLTLARIEIPNDDPQYANDPILFDSEKGKTLALTPYGAPAADKSWAMTHDTEGETWGERFKPVGAATRNFLKNVYDRVFKDLLVNIPAVRAIQPVGSNVAEALLSLSQGDARQIELHDAIGEYVKGLVFADEAARTRFAYPGDKGARRLKIQVSELQLPLAHYGSGVEQMLVLATEIAWHGPHKVICIEEPEAHFHPHLQREFIRFLRDKQNLLAHQYLLATQSSIFIDEFINNVQGRVFFVHREQEQHHAYPKYSRIEPFDVEKSQDVFRNLGGRPSDLLLANGVLVVEGPTDKDVYTDWARKIEKPFERASIEVIDVGGARNISKYLGSNVIKLSCYGCYGLCDKNAEGEVRKKLEGIVPDENIKVLEKGDLEDYYPRDLVLEFARDWGKVKNKKEEEIPKEIPQGETVKVLNGIFHRDSWKTKLADKVIHEMKPDDVPDEVASKLGQIYDEIMR